jgi:hypothetical protein
MKNLVNVFSIIARIQNGIDTLSKYYPNVKEENKVQEFPKIKLETGVTEAGDKTITMTTEFKTKHIDLTIKKNETKKEIETNLECYEASDDSDEQVLTSSVSSWCPASHENYTKTPIVAILRAVTGKPGPLFSASDDIDKDACNNAGFFEEYINYEFVM